MQSGWNSLQLIDRNKYLSFIFNSMQNSFDRTNVSLASPEKVLFIFRVCLVSFNFVNGSTQLQFWPSNQLRASYSESQPKLAGSFLPPRQQLHGPASGQWICTVTTSPLTNDCHRPKRNTSRFLMQRLVPPLKLI